MFSKAQGKQQRREATAMRVLAGKVHACVRDRFSVARDNDEYVCTTAVRSVAWERTVDETWDRDQPPSEGAVYIIESPRVKLAGVMEPRALYTTVIDPWSKRVTSSFGLTIQAGELACAGAECHKPCQWLWVAVMHD